MEAWEMTREEYLNKDDNFPELPTRVKLMVGGGLADFDEVISRWHTKFVKEAIEQGKPVPERVLREAAQ